MKFTLELKGTSPLLMHNPRMVDPQFPIVIELKALTSKKRKTDEDLANIARLEWHGGLFEEDGVVVMTTAKVRKCFIETARINKMGKNVERAVAFGSVWVPLIYDGPKNIDELFADKRFHSYLSVGVNGKKRVMRTRPKFFPWAVKIDGLLVEGAGLNFDELEKIAELSGVTVGAGDNRVNGYGRFEGRIVKR